MLSKNNFYYSSDKVISCKNSLYLEYTFHYFFKLFILNMYMFFLYIRWPIKFVPTYREADISYLSKLKLLNLAHTSTFYYMISVSPVNINDLYCIVFCQHTIMWCTPDFCNIMKMKYLHLNPIFIHFSCLFCFCAFFNLCLTTN